MTNASKHRPSFAARVGRRLAAGPLLFALTAALTPGWVGAQDLPIKLNPPLVTGGNVTITRLSPDGRTVVYRADQETDNVFELFSVPISGGAVVKLNDPLPPDDDVSNGGFRITPDGRNVIYQDSGSRAELFSVPISGGEVTRLNNPLPSGGTIIRFRISPDSSTVVYVGDQDRDNVFELYSVPVEGGAVTKLNPSLSGARDVLSTSVRISPDSSTVVYRADQDTDDVQELYSVPIGGGTVTKLNSPLPAGGDVDSSEFRISPDSRTVVYIAEQEANNLDELFSVPIGGGPSTRLNSDLPSGGDIFSFLLTPDGSRVIYRGEQTTDDIEGLFSVPIAGGDVTPLSAPDQSLFFFGIDADSSTVVYQTDTNDNGFDEVFSVPVIGGTPTRLNAPLPPGHSVSFFRLSADGGTVLYTLANLNESPPSVLGDEALPIAFFSVPISGGLATILSPKFPLGSGIDGIQITPDSRSVFYTADQDTRGVFELYRVPINGGDSIKLNAPLVNGGDVDNFRVAPDSESLFYTADQDTDGVEELYSTGPLLDSFFGDSFESAD